MSHLFRARLFRAVLLAVTAFCVASPAASAAPPNQLRTDLGAMWTKILETPSAQNSFGTGDLNDPSFGCWNLGSLGVTVAPAGPSGVPSCTVKPGTKIFVSASSVECSTFEGNGTTEAELRTCAVESDVKSAPTVTVDGKSVPMTEVETQLLNITLPADNIFPPLPTGTTGQSVAHGWVALLNPLTPGSHVIMGTGTVAGSFTTTINVQPRS